MVIISLDDPGIEVTSNRRKQARSQAASGAKLGEAIGLTQPHEELQRPARPG